FAIHTQERSVGVDDRGRIAIHTRSLTLEHWHHDDHFQFARELLHRVRARARNGFGQVEAVAFLRLAEVGRAKELLQADDLRALGGGLAHQFLRAAHVLLQVCARVVLNDAYGELAHINSQLPTPNYQPLPTPNCQFPRLPTTNHQPPTTNHEPPTTNHEPPTTNHQPIKL